MFGLCEMLLAAVLSLWRTAATDCKLCSPNGPLWNGALLALPLLGVCSDLYGEIIGCILIAVVQSDACAWSVL